MMLTGSNGVLTRAGEAKTANDVAQTEERIKLAYHSALMADLTSENRELTKETLQAELNKEFTGKEVTITESEENWIIAVDGVEVSVKAGKDDTQEVANLPTGAGTKPYLPTGFKKLEGTDLSTGSEGGLVITDATGTENGNEYVWVEVPNANLGGTPTFGPNYSAQGLEDTEIIGELTDEQKNKIEVALRTYVYSSLFITRPETVNNNPSADDYKKTTLGWVDEWYDKNSNNETISTDTADTTGCGLSLIAYNTKYKDMLKSLYNNGGFWIGRYEAGIEGSDTNISLARQNHTNITSGSPNAVTKRDCIPYNWVYCNEAQQLAERAGANLLFGIQWDLTLKYLQVTGAVNQAGLTSNSEGWGNYNLSYNLNQQATHGYKGVLSTSDNSTINWSSITSSYSHSNGYEALSTGATERNSKKNIYDLAGNMYEYTLEHAKSYSNYKCTSRGGGYVYTGSEGTSSVRGSGFIMKAMNFLGFRFSL